MKTDAVYLRPEVKLEPLVCGWYAWSHLIAPIQLAHHLTYRLLPLLRSFAEDPEPHVFASSDPAMYGGPFVSLHEERVAQARHLAESTEAACHDLLQLASDFKALDAFLQERATGYSLNEFYSELPWSLRGLVELQYDLHHRPHIRLFESLLHDQHALQPVQEIFLHTTPEALRPFFMSTPRLPNSGTLSFKTAFSDKRLDYLAAMRNTPAPLEDVSDLFQISDNERPLFRSLFRSSPPARRGSPGYDAPGVRMRYFGHACVLFQCGGTSLLFDPFVALEEKDDGRFTMSDLPDVIDYVVLTHSHHDHFNPEMLLQLRHRIRRVIAPRNNSGNIADPCMKIGLRELGFDVIEMLDPFDTVDLPDGRITSLPFTGEHADLNVHSKQAILLKLGGRQFMFLVDSDGRDIVLYQRQKKKLGPVDALFIGMECQGAPLNWLYEPLLGKPTTRRNNESRRLSGSDCERAWKIQCEVKARRVFVYAMGQEPWMSYVMGLQYAPDSIQLIESDKFVNLCRRHDIAAERLFISKEVVF